jgi:uncharacterized protein YxjI
MRMLELQRFFIKEQVAFLRSTSTYDIFDPDTREQVGVAREQPGSFARILRWFVSKRLTATSIEVYETEDESLVFTIHRPMSLWQERVNVYDADHRLMGYFLSKVLSWGRGFWVYDHEGLPFAELKGDWVGWNFVFVTPEGQELGAVTKSWAGLGRELFTSADNYVVSIHEELEDQPIAKMLLLAAALAVDLVYYENGK